MGMGANIWIQFEYVSVLEKENNFLVTHDVDMIEFLSLKILPERRTLPDVVFYSYRVGFS